MSVTDTIGKLVERLPKAALPFAAKLFEDALASDDPVDYIARRAQADAAHAASQETVRLILEGK